MLQSKKVTNLVDKVANLNRVWEILSISYKDVPGGLLFADKNDLLYSTVMWKLILKKGKIIAVTVFKAKFGLKLVAMGADKLFYGKQAVVALSKSITEDLKHIWMEVSDAAETFLMTQCHAYKYSIHNSFAAALLKKSVIIESDGYHYSRKISDISKSKIIVGTPSASMLFNTPQNNTY